jgi:hypothetical protein
MPTPPKKPTKKPGAKPPASKAPAAKNPAAKTPVAKKPAPKKSAAKTPIAKQPAGPPDFEWVNAFPPLQALAGGLGELGFKLASLQESEEAGEALEERYAGNPRVGVLWSHDLWAACQARAQGLRLFAHGPDYPREGGVTTASGLYFHPERPGELLFAPSPDFPALLFVPLAAQGEALRGLMEEVDPARPAPDCFQRTRVERAFMGNRHQLRVPNPYSGKLEEAGPHELDRHFTCSPAAKGMAWGTSRTEDPFPGNPLAQGGARRILAMATLSPEVRQQLPGAVARLTRATRFSRSHLGVEMHSGGVYVWHVAFKPSRISASTIARFNEVAGYRLPGDMPVDLAVAIHGFEWMDLPCLTAELAQAEDPEQVAGLVRVLLAVQHEDLGAAVRTLHQYADHPAVEVRGVLANACVDYNWEFFLEELALKDPDPGVREFAEQVMASGIRAPAFNDMGEPLEDDEEAR